MTRMLGIRLAPLLQLLLSLLGAAPASAERLFDARYLPAPSGYGARASAVADCDRDGLIDLVVANSRDSTLSVLLGNGDGFFTFTANLRTGQFPRDVAVADLNADQLVDAVVVNQNSNSVSVFIGHGDGTFAPKVNYATGARPYSVDITDIHGDGIPDVIVPNRSSGTVSLLAGAGDGTLAPRVDLSVGGSPLAVAIGDLDGNPGPDLAVATSTTNSITLFYNDGTGGFPFTGLLAVGGIPADVAIADCDEDEYSDVLVLRDSPRDFVRFVGSAGGFSPSPVPGGSAGAVPVSLVVADMNRDSHLDVAIANYYSFNVSIWSGDGSGSFSAEMPVLAGYYPYDVVLADVDDDDRLDLIVTNESNTGLGDVYVIPGNGDGTFMKDDFYPVPVGPQAIAAGDVNGDSWPDVVVTCNPQPSPQDSVTVYLNSGGGALTARTNYFAGTSPGDVSLSDINSDGLADIAVAESGLGQLGVRLGNGDGTFGDRLMTPTNSGSGQLVIADMNGDLIPDAVVGSGGVTGVQLGLGNGYFGVPMNVQNGPELGDLAVGDLNGDGYPDVVRAYTLLPSKVWVHLNLGNGSLGAATAFSVGVSGEAANAVACGDVTGDGILDVQIATSTTLVTWKGVGNGALTSRTSYPMGHSASGAGISVARLDDDEFNDIVISHSSSMGRVSVFISKGNAGFEAEQLYGSGPYGFDVTVDDFNRDGRSDLVVTSSPGGSGPGYVCILKGRTTPLADVSELTNVGSGHLILSANPARGRVAIHLPASDFPSTLDVFDVMGRRVVRLLDGRPVAAGSALTWSGEGRDGPAGPGIYFLRHVSSRVETNAKLVWLGR